MMTIDRERPVKITLSSDQYETVYEKVSRHEEMTDDLETAFFSQLVPNDKKYKILDLGCAEGKLSFKLAKNGHYVVASDISAGYLDQVNKAAKSQSINLETIRCDIEKSLAQLEGREFDYIFFMDVIEHLRSPLAGLENIRKVLSNNGSLFIHTPNACAAMRVLWLLKNNAKTPNILNPNTVSDLHLQLFDYKSLTQLCNFAGFKVIRLIPTTNKKAQRSLPRVFSKTFPALGETLLLECKKCPPIDIDEVVSHWISSTDQMETSALPK